MGLHSTFYLLAGLFKNCFGLIRRNGIIGVLLPSSVLLAGMSYNHNYHTHFLLKWRRIWRSLERARSCHPIGGDGRVFHKVDQLETHRKIYAQILTICQCDSSVAVGFWLWIKWYFWSVSFWWLVTDFGCWFCTIFGQAEQAFFYDR